MILKYLPKNIIFVLLTDECRERLKYAIKNSFGTIRNISRILNMNENYFSRWLNGDRYIPLNILIQLHSLSKKKGFDIDFENYIKEYRLSRGGTVKNPKFPINEVALANVYMHLIGDGYVSKKQVPEYHNSDKGVREEFKEAVRCFGEVSITEKEDSIYIPTLIAEILKHRYKIDVFGSHDAKIPQIFFDFPKEIIASGIRAFADDEAAVSDTNIRFYSSNRSLLKQLRELIICKFSKDIKNGIPLRAIKDIRKSYAIREYKKHWCFYFDITKEGLEPYRKLIGFSHSKKKADLEFNLTRFERGWHQRLNGETRKIILKELAKGKKTAKELSMVTNIRLQNILAYHIPRLIKENLIEECGRTKTNARLWKLKN